MKHLLPLLTLLLPSFALAQSTQLVPARPPEPAPVAVYAAVHGTPAAMPPKYPDYWAHHKDPLVRELVAILHETHSSDTFLTALVLLEKRDVDRERLIPVILRNAERVGLFSDAHVNGTETRKQVVQDLQALLMEMAGRKDQAPERSPPTARYEDCSPRYYPPPPAPPPATAPLPQKPPPPTVHPTSHQPEFRTPVMPPLPEGAPPPRCEEPPSDAEVLRALPRLHRIPHVYEESRDDVQIVKELLVDKVDPPRFFPLVGPARLHHCHWKCTVYYTETIETSFPFPLRYVRPRAEVVYIDRDRLHLAAEPTCPEGDAE